jgi:16S rRNA (cytidine1402-2'-O)-methyltransferase
VSDVGSDRRLLGTLFLIPTPLGASPLDWVLPEGTCRIARRLDRYIVEHAKTARAFLRQIGTDTPLQQIEMHELSEHTPAGQLKSLLTPLLDGHDIGLISEAGCPAIADPGADLARLAHRHGIIVKPLVGPSSILLALMGSGLVGQRFAFHGYLPSKPDERSQAIKGLETRAQKDNAAQAFIETPYRNRAMLDSLLQTCRGDTWLTLACDLTLTSEFLQSRRVDEWRKHAKPDLDRRPCVFVLWRE